MINSSVKGALCAALSVGLLASPATALPALEGETSVAGELSGTAIAGSGVVINEAYVNGGSAGAPFKNKFVELYNPTDAAVSLEGWSSSAAASPPRGIT